ncbi:MAG: hypothetical protein ACQSGP_12025 [Frankia sp.]
MDLAQPSDHQPRATRLLLPTAFVSSLVSARGWRGPRMSAIIAMVILVAATAACDGPGSSGAAAGLAVPPK